MSADHGTYSRYVHDRCRCDPCTNAARENNRHRRRLQAYGRYNKYVDADPIRNHVNQLRAAGMGTRTIAKRTGVAHGTLSKLLFGVYAPTNGPHQGRNGAGILTRPPSRRVLRATAERLLSLNPNDPKLPLAEGALVPLGDAQRIRRQLRSLVAIGWPIAHLIVKLEIASGPSGYKLFNDNTASVRASTARKAEELFDELCMTPGHSPRARNDARRKGWSPPLDLDIDDLAPIDPHYNLDDVAIERRISGDKTVPLTQEERRELARRWAATRLPLNAMERTTGINAHRYNQPKGDTRP